MFTVCYNVLHYVLCSVNTGLIIFSCFPGREQVVGGETNKIQGERCRQNERGKRAFS